MKTLTIRGVPDEVHADLRDRARKNRRSLNQQVIAELSESVVQADQQSRIERLLAGAESVQRGVRRPLGRDEISAAINEGRR